MSNYVTYEDGTITDQNGKIISFGFKRFVDDICNGDNCLICGAKREDKSFNDEHVIPKWVLRYCDLFKEHIILPNTVKLRYDKYVLPCCSDCNSFYGENLENKIQPILTSPYNELKSLINEEIGRLLYVWFAFVVFKTHLKDTLLRLHQDRRKGEDKIASKYQFEWLHHLHAVVRSLYTGSKISQEAIGTFIVLNADTGNLNRPFDYRDVNGVNTGLIRIGDKALLCALDDARLSLRFLRSRLDPVLGQPLNPIQLREMLAHLTYIKKSLVNPPLFRTEYDLDEQLPTIKVTIPEDISLVEYKYEDYGAILYLCTFDMIDNLIFEEGFDIHAQVKSGKIGFTVDENYNFVRQSSPQARK
ncbi:hypothetical protein [Pseudidiomarina sediminum]|uniref:hypothetical protein n=1 Tax=Pseudidiomarina sediminum TaxID=431675 RepID=UPI001C986157|nr:hypothetical protein [Pseudidiomarina sediminum]MBY6065005.1 hypothetical protein [Pseudidiomarina sediminum]